MHILKVGDRYNAKVSQWTEGMHILGLSAERPQVMIAMPRPSASEIEAFRSGPMNVGLASHGSVVVILVRIDGSIDWSDAPFDIRLAPVTERTPPGERLAVSWVLVDSRNGIVEAMRMTSLTRTFTDLLRARLEGQLAAPFNRARYDREVSEYQRRFEIEAMVRRAWIVETPGLADSDEMASNHNDR